MVAGRGLVNIVDSFWHVMMKRMKSIKSSAKQVQ